MGQSLRSSRRRVQKHSAVVLNADRLKKFASSASTSALLDDSAILDDSMMSQSDANLSFATETTVESHSNITINFRIKVDEMEATKIIQRWWQRILFLRRWKYMQYGKWDINRSDKVFSLILGHKLRKLISLNDCQKLMRAENDVRKVITELLLPYAKSTVIAQHSSLQNSEEAIGKMSINLVQTWLLNVQELSRSHSLLSGPDQQLIKSLIKQLLLERSKVYKYIFEQAIFRSFPAPGYWHLLHRLINVEEQAQKAQKRQSILQRRAARLPPTNNVSIPAAASLLSSELRSEPITLQRTPVRPLKSTPTMMEETPPHVKQAMSQHDTESHASIRNKKLPFKFLSQHQQQTQQQQPMAISPSELTKDQSLFHAISPGITEENSGGDESEELHVIRRPSTAPTSSTLNTNNTHNNLQKKGQPSIPTPIIRPSTTATGRTPSVSSSSSLLPNDLRKRAHDGGHIQLEILSGEKIMPAKKVK